MAINGAVNLGLPTNSGTAVTPFTLSAAGLLASAFYGDITLRGVTLSGSLEGPKALPALTLSASGVAGSKDEGDLFLPAPTVSASSYNGSASSGSIRLPALTLAANTGTRANLTLGNYWISLTATGATGTIGHGGNKNRTGDGLIIGPKFTLSGAMKSELLADGAVTLDQPTLAADGIAGTASQGDVLLRAPRLIADLLAGQAPAGAVVLPALALSARLGLGTTATAAITLPSLSTAGVMPLAPVDGTGRGDLAFETMTLAGTLLPGLLSDGALTMRGVTLNATLSNTAIMDGDIRFAEFSLNAQANLTSNTADAVIRIDEMLLSAQAVTGNAATADLQLPLFTLNASTGQWDQTGTGSILLPLFQIGGDGAFIGIDGGTIVQTLPALSVVAIAVNTRTRAVTNYEGLAPNSLASFNGATLMATADGIVALTGDTDDAAQIDAYFITGKSDLGQRVMKRVLTGYVGYWASGEMELTLITDDHHQNVYTLAPRQIDGESHASRVKFGRGVSGMYWQFKAANVDGSDFGMDRIELHTASTGMRV